MYEERGQRNEISANWSTENIHVKWNEGNLLFILTVYSTEIAARWSKTSVRQEEVEKEEGEQGERWRRRQTIFNIDKTWHLNYGNKRSQVRQFAMWNQQRMMEQGEK